LENLDPSELILMDKNYADRIKYRTGIMRKHTTNTVNISEENPASITPAIREYYTYVMGTYLPLRYPTMFKLHQTHYETGQTFMLENKINGSIVPASPVKHMQPLNLLETLGRTIDEDVLFLLPEQIDSETEGKYHLLAYVTCCPSGFDPKVKIDNPLASIHAPVPGYKEKLESSMDRYFAKLEVGKFVKRVNWSVTIDADLYAGTDASKGSTHAHDGDEVIELKSEDLDVEKAFLRCERQTLFRLPESKAIVFSFKTYLYPLKEVKEEGNGEALAEAIEGLRLGNVGGDEKNGGRGGMWFYKRGGVWGSAVTKYLRS
jgi:hypothetical protein